MGDCTHQFALTMSSYGVLQRYRHILVDQSQQASTGDDDRLVFYMLNMEHAQSEANMQITHSSNVDIYGLKVEGSVPVSVHARACICAIRASCALPHIAVPSEPLVRASSNGRFRFGSRVLDLGRMAFEANLDEALIVHDDVSFDCCPHWTECAILPHAHTPARRWVGEVSKKPAGIVVKRKLRTKKGP